MGTTGAATAYPPRQRNCQTCGLEMKQVGPSEWLCGKAPCPRRDVKIILGIDLKERIDPLFLRDIIREYGAYVSDADYEAVYRFGVWFGGQLNRCDVILSDWSPWKKETV